MFLRQPPRRTGATDLTDDELLLFDALFSCPWPMFALRRLEYGFHLNVGYSHNLDDDGLLAGIEALVERGLMATDFRDPCEGRNLRYCALTAAGGEQWECERRPDWSKFCSDSYPEGHVEIDAYCTATAEAYMHAIEQCHDESLDIARAVFRRFETGGRSRPWPLISWRASALDYTLVVPVIESKVLQPHEKKREDYEARRWWWRTISELAMLPRKSEHSSARAAAS